MKFFINILLLYFLFVGNSFSKILNITNDFRLDVSNNVDFIKIENIDGLNSDLDFLEEYGLNLYVVGNRGIIDFFEKYFNGNNLEEEDWIIELVSKVEKKAQKTKSRSSLISYTKKEIKKIMIKYNLTTWTLVLALDKPFQNTELELELTDFLEELEIYNHEEQAIQSWIMNKIMDPLDKGNAFLDFGKENKKGTDYDQKFREELWLPLYHLLFLELCNPKGLVGDIDKVFQLFDSVAVSVLTNYFVGNPEEGYMTMKPMLDALKEEDNK